MFINCVLLMVMFIMRVNVDLKCNYLPSKNITLAQTNFEKFHQSVWSQETLKATAVCE